MPLQHFTTLRGVSDAAVYPVTADTSGSLTYGTKVDLVGVRSAAVTWTLDDGQIEGDDVILDYRSKVIGASLNIEAAKVNLDILKNVAGTSAVVDSGTTPNQLSTLTFAQSDVPGAWKFVAQVTQVDAGLAAAVLTFYKVRMTAMPLNVSYGNFATLNFTGQAFFTINTPSKIADIAFQETAATI